MNFRMDKIKTYAFLHFILFLYSLSTVCSKVASKQEFLSNSFIVYYALIIIILGIYAISWQQVIKRLPLTEAFANKAITVVWGIIWGFLIFSERISRGKIIGALLVIAGVILFSTTGEENE